jgi:hypothetical protein
MTDRLRALLAGLGFGALVASSACTGLGVPSYGCSNDDNCEGGQVCRDGACVIECLDDLRARAKRPLTPHMLPYLPSGILESPALAPYLHRWRLDAAAVMAAAPTRARCSYPTLD